MIYSSWDPPHINKELLCTARLSHIVCLSPGKEGSILFQFDGGPTRRRKWILCFPPISCHHLPATHEAQHGNERAQRTHKHSVFKWVIKWAYAVIACLSGCVCFTTQLSLNDFEKKTRLTEAQQQQQVRDTSCFNQSCDCSAFSAQTGSWISLITPWELTLLTLHLRVSAGP